MEIYYKHKETGIKISHKDLKEKQSSINLGCVDNFGNMITSGTYKYYEIPFSDDFETICVTTEFTIEELSRLLYALTNCSAMDYDLYKKIKRMFPEERIND